MKWVKVISLVTLLSFTESRILNKRDHPQQDEQEVNVLKEYKTAGDIYKSLGEDTFKALAMIIFSQYLQKCHYEEQAQRVKDITELAQKCSTGIKTTECGKSVIVAALDEMCKAPEDAVKYPVHAECCAKPDPDRNVCFLSHKITNSEDLPPYKTPEPEQACKDYQEKRVTFMGHYIHGVAQRHPFLYSPVILTFADHFEKIVIDCCQNAAASGTCFAEKMPAHITELQQVSSLLKHNCDILDTFGEKTLKDIKVIQTSQKYPKASFQDMHDIVVDLTHLHADCCSGHVMECTIGRMELNAKLCERESAISSKLKECCDKPVTEHTECIVKMDNDEKPDDLRRQIGEFMDKPTLCKQIAEQKDAYLASFLYEYSRRNPELSVQLLLRIGKAYEELLTQCCREETSHPCLLKWEDLFKNEIESSQQLLKRNCDALQKVGAYHFQNGLLVRYTQIMPQVTDTTLIEITKAITDTEATCCKLPEDKQMTCSEGKLSIIIGEMCDRQKTTFVNDKVKHCCSDSYALRRPCFTALGVDDSYVPPPFSPDMFKFSADLCTITSPLEIVSKKQTFLIHLVKLKPRIQDDEVKPVIAAFLSLVDQCCKADNHEECFTVEGPKLIDIFRAILEVKADSNISV